MKDFSVLVTPGSNSDDLIVAIRSRLTQGGNLSAHDYLVMEELIRCVDEYHRRARDLNVAGTVIRIEKIFQFSFAKIIVRLLAPDSRNLIQRLLDKLRGSL